MSVDGKVLSHIFTSPEDISNKSDAALMAGIAKQFPIETKDLRLEVSNMFVDKKTFTKQDEKDAILRSKSLTYPIRGDLTLIDKKTGKVVDTEKRFPLSDAFALTDKHTMIYGGNNYAIANLLLLQPGVYHHYKTNGVLESHFNFDRGRSMALTLDPENQRLTVNVESTKIPASFLLHEVFGVGKSEATRFIPETVWDSDMASASGKEERLLSSFYDKIVPTRVQRTVSNPDTATKKMMIREAISASITNPDTTAITLGKPFTSFEPEMLLRSMGELIKIHRGERAEDNRDSLMFKRVNNLPDFIARRFKENKEHEVVKTVDSKLAYQLEKGLRNNNLKIKTMLPAKPFSKVMQNFIVDSTLSFAPSETNPVESLETVSKATVLGDGEGGITVRQAKTKTRNIDPTHLGILDPSRTPESENAGVDLRFTLNAARDDDGKMYSRMLDKSGKEVYISAAQIMKSVIGFPGQKGDMVQAQIHGTLGNTKRDNVDYWLPTASDMYGVTTNLVPFVNANHPGRLTMAGKAITQALSLKERETPLVTTLNGEGTKYIDLMGNHFCTKAPEAGVVKSIGKDKITLSTDKGDVKVDMVHNLPFNQKGFITDENPLVKVGDKVTAGQSLVDNNYTKGGQLAIGKNLYAAYLPYKAYNHEDGIVISKSAAERLDSLHAYKFDYQMGSDIVSDKALFRNRMPNQFTAEQYAKLDAKGFIKKGEKVNHGDPIYVLLQKRVATPSERAYGRLHKSLLRPYNSVVEYWTHDEPGEIVDVHTETRDVRIIARSIKPLEIGDKLTGLHGNKGIVSLILPDEHMPYNKETGEPVDLLLNPASVTSRINLGQVMETAAGKIAKKTGKAYEIKNYSDNNLVSKLQKELKEHGLTDTDQLIDPVSKKELKVLAGPQFFLKLYKTTDQNYSARNIGGYDAVNQPTKGGEEGSKRNAYMEFLGLLGSDSRNILREMGTTKSEKNEEFWNSFEAGHSLPKPKMTFATKKFFNYLKGSGIDVRDTEDKISLAPLTDHKILSMSNGEVGPEMFNSKDLTPEKGGLFDLGITGGPEGQKWSHYNLVEPIVNPVFAEPVKRVLGLSKGEFDGITEGSMGVRKKSSGHYELFDTVAEKKLRDIHIAGYPMVKAAAKAKDSFDSVYDEDETLAGGSAFQAMLSDVKVNEALAHSVQSIKTATSDTKRNDEIKKAKFLRGLRDTGFDKASDAYILRNIPVLPPVMRPSIPDNGKITHADVSQLYRDHMLVNQAAREGMLLDILPHSENIKTRRNLYDGAAAVVGLGDPISPKESLKGLLKQIAGEGGPKTGYFHDRILSKKQDFSGRATIYAAPDVAFNEAKVPADQLWTMYKYHILRTLTKRGYNVLQARKAVETRNPAAQAAFNEVIEKVPMLINRAPTLMRTNIMAVKPIPTTGKTLGLNPLHLPGFAADYDGDAMTLHVPMSDEAVAEANEKMLPMHHLNDARRGYGVPMFAPGHEAILGSVHLTEPDNSLPVVDFKTEAEAIAAMKSGKIRSNQPIRIVG